MKKVILSFMAIVFVATTAQAVVLLPGEERPIYQADMIIKKINENYGNIFNVRLTMTRQDGVGEDPTGLELRFDTLDRVMHDIQHHEILFKVVEKRDIGCGSVEYIAYDNVEPDFGRGAYQLILQDHSRSICPDYKPYLWEAQVNSLSCVLMELMTLKGNPEPVFTPALVHP